MKKKYVWAYLIILLVLLSAVPVSAATPEEIADSIDDGIAWLVSVQNGDGSWSGSYASDTYGTTGLVLVKLQDRAFELGYDGPFDPQYPYKTNVEKGLTYLLNSASSVSINPQIAGDPDTDGDGLGVYVGNRVYDTGILMMAIAAGRDPAQTVSSGPLSGWTYDDVLQDLTDWMAYAQTDIGSRRGGWYYNAITGGSSADQSNAGYAILGLLYADSPLYGYQSDIPPFVKTELNNWIDYIQSDWSPAGINPIYDGGSGYTDPDSWVNSLKTGNLLTQMAFVGDDSSDERVQEALKYIGRHWNGDWTQGWGKSATVQYQATYCLMKGFETIDTPMDGVPGVADWYQDMANEILPEQNVDGSWPSSPGYVTVGGSGSHYVSRELSTAWALLTLERFAPPASFDVIKSVSDTVINSGDSVTYTYKILNQRDALIQNVVLTDDQLGVIFGPNSGDDNNDGILDPGETWIYTATTNLFATTTNIAVVTGEDYSGAIITATSDPVTVTVQDTPSVPEFPTLQIPFMMLGAISMLVLYFRKK